MRRRDDSASGSRPLSLANPRSPWDGLLDASRGRSNRFLNRVGWALCALGVVLFLGQLVLPIDPQDEGQFLTYPWLIAAGRVPYKDIWMSYPPATYALLVPFAKVGIPLLIPERALGLLSRIGYVLLVNRLLTGSWRRWSWTAGPAALALVFLGSDVKAYPWLVALPLFVLGLACVRRPLVAALLFLLAGTFRFEFALAGDLTLVCMALLSLRNIAVARTYLIAAVVLTLGSTCFYGLLALVTGGAAWTEIFTDQVTTVQRGRYLSLFPLPFGPLGVPVLIALLAAPVVTILLGAAARREDIVATNLATLVLLPHFFQRVDASHLFTTAALVVPWTIYSLTYLPGGHLQQRPGVVRPWITGAAGATLAALAVSVVAWPYLIMLAYGVYLSPLSPWSDRPISNIGDLLVHSSRLGIASDREEARDTRRIAAYLHHHAHADDGILIIPASLTSAYTRTDLYYVFGIRPSGKYLEVQPNIFTQRRAQQQIIESLQTCRWVLLLRGGRWYGPSDAHSHYPLTDYVRRHYTAVTATSTYVLLRASRGARHA